MAANGPAKQHRIISIKHLPESPMAVWQSPRDSRAPLTCGQCTTLAESVSDPPSFHA